MNEVFRTTFINTNYSKYRLIHTNTRSIQINADKYNEIHKNTHHFSIHTNATQYVSMMIEFVFPNSRALLPTFLHFSNKLPRWVSLCPDLVSFCPEDHPQSLFFTQPSHTPFGYKTHQNLPQNTPFPGLNLPVGKMNYLLSNLDPHWTK